MLFAIINRTLVLILPALKLNFSKKYFSIIRNSGSRVQDRLGNTEAEYKLIRIEMQQYNFSKS